MIVKHRPQDAGKETEYTIACHRADFILIRELIAIQLEALDTVKEDGKVKDFHALLMLIGMQLDRVSPIRAEIKPKPVTT